MSENVNGIIAARECCHKVAACSEILDPPKLRAGSGEMSPPGLVCCWRGATNFERGLRRGVARQVGDEAKRASVILKGQAGLLITAFEFAPFSGNVKDAGVAIDGAGWPLSTEHELRRSKTKIATTRNLSTVSFTDGLLWRRLSGNNMPERAHDFADELAPRRVLHGIVYG